MTRTRWSKTEDDLICRLRRGGADFDDIARQMPGRSAGAIRVRVQRLIANGRLTSTRATWSDDEDALLCQLRSADNSLDAIAERLPHRTRGALAVRIGHLIRQGRIEARWAPTRERRPWTAREESILLEMRARDATLDEIAARLPGRTRPAVARRVAALIEDGVIPPRAHAPLSHQAWSPEEDALVVGMIRAGKTPEQMAQALGRTLPSVKSRISQRRKRAGGAGRPPDEGDR